MTHVKRLPAMISLQHVTFQFANGETLLADVNLSIDHTSTGIVGRNGRGKSVLAQLIAGVLVPSSGSITRSASAVYVPQRVVVNPGMSVADLSGTANVLAALERMAAGAAHIDDFDLIDNRWDLPERLRAALDEAGLGSLAADSSAEQLSGGQLARVVLIGALLASPQVLVLDEPTNHLDSDGRAWLMRALGQWRGGLVVVSHDRPLLDSLARIVEVSPLGLLVYGGNYETYRRQRDAEQQAAVAALEQARLERSRERRRLQKDHDTLQRNAARAHQHAQTANVDRFTQARWKRTASEVVSSVRSEQYARKQQLDTQVRQAHERVEEQSPTLIALPASTVPKGRLMLRLVDACLPWLHTPALTLSLMGPVRVIVQGPNGCGKSTLLKVLAGDSHPVSGECCVPVPTAYIDQQLAFLEDRRSVIEHLNLLETPLAEGELRTRLALLQLNAVRVTQPVAQLSGGERLKAAMAIALWREIPAQLLLLDEPTNHLDLESVLAFEQALQGFAGALVVVSHDEAFIQAIGPTHRLQWTSTGWCLEAV
ncbi:ATP-binding cassette domain-containing protein [Pseudomonas rhodesiae]|uniref:ABC-F family ATP-binding cassette domain-containing protein n=1 Tax=Pseudomonas TaxID=286 RepID=UPI001C7DC8BF|nr:MULTISPECIES: ABC-F family ATP-binding cassette domain-containing protein [Pseudomonas]MBX4134839.1 ATP-binding cassette domain-containing protein [Pseudomonas sp. S5F11]UVL11533.1 ATP-binding cassette domain-containing protein [Pseudomonas rhodesiae]